MHCKHIGPSRRNTAYGIASAALLICLGAHPASATEALFDQGAVAQRSAESIQSSSNVAVDGAVRSIPAGGLALGRGAPEFMHEKFGECRWIDARTATESIFVPDRDLQGWMSFISATQRQGVNIDSCSCPATPSTLTASNGQSAPVIIASSYASGDGRPSPTSAYYLGRANASFPMTDGCASWTETVSATYQCTTGGWMPASVSRTESAHVGSCPEPEPEPEVWSRYDPPAPPVYEPAVTPEFVRYDPPIPDDPVVTIIGDPEPDEPVVVVEPPVVVDPPVWQPVIVVEDPEPCGRWGQNDVNFAQKLRSGQGGAFYGDCQ